jgi:HEAT repeat protein
MNWVRLLLVVAVAGAPIVRAEPPPATRPALSEKERQKVQEEADALAAQGAEGVAALAGKLQDRKPEWQLAALRALRNIRADAEPALDAIVGVLKADDPHLKREALQTLAALGPRAKSAIPAVIEASKETRDLNSIAFRPPSNVAEASVLAVQAIEPDAMPRLATAIIPGLLDVVGKKRPGWAAPAVGVLRKLGPHGKTALPRLKELLPDMTPETARDVLPVFLAHGDEGMAMLADFLLSPKATADVKAAFLHSHRWEKQSTHSTVRILRALLSDKAPAVRAAALETLGTVRAKELIPNMINLLADNELLKVRPQLIGEDPFYAARALGNQGKTAVEALSRALEDRRPLQRFQAARALFLMGKESTEAADPLEGVLEDPVPLVGIEAAKALLKAGKGAAKARAQLDKHLKADAKFLLAALEGVKELGPAGQPMFGVVKGLVLDSSDLAVQRTGFEAIRQIGAEPAEVAKLWAKLVPRHVVFLSFPPTDDIRAHGEEIQDVVPALLGYLKDKDVNTRRRATEALAALGPAAVEAIPTLVKVLEEKSFASDGAMDALGAMGKAARPAVAALVRNFEAIKLSDQEPEYHRKKILTTLEQIGPGAVEAVPRLIEWLPEHPQALRVLGKIAPDARDAVPALEKVYGKEPGYAKTWAAFGLVKITGRTEPYVPELARVLRESKAPDQRFDATEALAELGPDARAALPALLLMLRDKSPPGFPLRDTRSQAARALGHLGPAARDAVPDLIDMVQNSYYGAQGIAVEALGSIGPDAREAIPALEHLAQSDTRFRPAVEHALASIRRK